MSESTPQNSPDSHASPNWRDNIRSILLSVGLMGVIYYPLSRFNAYLEGIGCDTMAKGEGDTLYLPFGDSPFPAKVPLTINHFTGICEEIYNTKVDPACAAKSFLIYNEGSSLAQNFLYYQEALNYNIADCRTSLTKNF